MSKFIFLALMLICCSANADMYSCVDDSGTKTLKNLPCEQNEKQQVIVEEVGPSYSVIDSTGERQNYRGSESEKISNQNTTPSIAGTAPTPASSPALQGQQSLLDWANSAPTPEAKGSRLGVVAHMIGAQAAEERALRGMNGVTAKDTHTTPPPIIPNPAFAIPAIDDEPAPTPGPWYPPGPYYPPGPFYPPGPMPPE